jgi:hypothetical protein
MQEIRRLLDRRRTMRNDDTSYLRFSLDNLRDLAVQREPIVHSHRNADDRAEPKRPELELIGQLRKSRKQFLDFDGAPEAIVFV